MADDLVSALCWDILLIAEHYFTELDFKDGYAKLSITLEERETVFWRKINKTTITEKRESGESKRYEKVKEVIF